MPWPTYPMLLKTTSSHEEGAKGNGQLQQKNLLVMKMGNLKALKIVDLEWKIVDGKTCTVCRSSRTVKEKFPVNWLYWQWVLYIRNIKDLSMNLALNWMKEEM